MKITKRILAVVLAVSMTMSLGIVNVFATMSEVTSVTVTLDSAGTPKTVTTNSAGTADATIANATEGTLTVSDSDTLDDTKVTSAATDTDGTATVTKWGTFANKGAASAGALGTAAVELTDGEVLVVEVSDGTDTLYVVLTIDVSDSTSLPGDTTVPGAGETIYENLNKIAVWQPTGKSFDFQLDPQGLLALDGNTEVDLEDLVGGSIVSGPDVKVVNESTIPVKVSVKLKGQSSGTNDAKFIDLTTNEAGTVTAVETGTDNNLVLYAIPSSADVKAMPKDANGTIPAVPDMYVAADTGYIITASEQTMNFVLDKAAYTVSGEAADPQLNLKAGTGHGTGIKLGGRVNPNANWADFKAGAATPKTVSVSAVFSYTNPTTDELEDTGDGAKVTGIPGLLSTGLTIKSVTVSDIVPEVIGFKSGAPTAFTLSKSAMGTTAVVNFEFGDETLDAIYWSAAPDTEVPTTEYTVDTTAGTITFTSSRTTTMKAGANGAYMNIKLDGSTTNYVLSLGA